ncbi:MAG: flagellar hook-basal body complex protein FliE [Moorella sp. (in: firmicutes)]|nr:flagellar hook-basal body complex protein FliE [Moorella sp. (in: firmicutes)]
MLLTPITLLQPAPIQETQPVPSQARGTEAVARSFSDLLQQKLDELNNLQQQADALTRGYFAGKVEDVHQVILALEEANLSLQLAMQVRNKAVEAYQEISRMQI